MRVRVRIFRYSEFIVYIEIVSVDAEVVIRK